MRWNQLTNCMVREYKSQLFSVRRFTWTQSQFLDPSSILWTRFAHCSQKKPIKEHLHIVVIIAFIIVSVYRQSIFDCTVLRKIRKKKMKMWMNLNINLLVFVADNSIQQVAGYLAVSVDRIFCNFLWLWLESVNTAQLSIIHSLNIRGQFCQMVCDAYFPSKLYF